MTDGLEVGAPRGAGPEQDRRGAWAHPGHQLPVAGSAVVVLAATADAPVGKSFPDDRGTGTPNHAATTPADTAPGLAREPASHNATLLSEPLPSASSAPTPEGRVRDEQLLAAVRDAPGTLTVADLTKTLGTDARSLLRRLRPRLGLEHGTATHVLKYVQEHKEPLALQLCGRPLEDLTPADNAPSPLTEQDKQLIGAVLRYPPTSGAYKLARTYNQPQAFVKHALEQLGRRLGMTVTPAQLVAYIHDHQAGILATAGLTDSVDSLPDLRHGRG